MIPHEFGFYVDFFPSEKKTFHHTELRFGLQHEKNGPSGMLWRITRIKRILQEPFLLEEKKKHQPCGTTKKWHLTSGEGSSRQGGPTTYFKRKGFPSANFLSTRGEGFRPAGQKTVLARKKLMSGPLPPRKQKYGGWVRLAAAFQLGWKFRPDEQAQLPPALDITCFLNFLPLWGWTLAAK